MTIQDFITKWRKVELKERSAAQEHFIDLCNAFEHPTPAFADPTGDSFCFEKGASKHGGGEGFADVWKRGSFGIEYKGKHKDLTVAYDQLLRYRNALENPPLLIVCDLDRIVVHTNFTGTVSVAHELPLEDLGAPRVACPLPRQTGRGRCRRLRLVPRPRRRRHSGETAGAEPGPGGHPLRKRLDFSMYLVIAPVRSTKSPRAPS